MIKFIIRRLFQGILVLIGVVFVIFTLFEMSNVDTARIAAGEKADDETIALIKKKYNLDEPYLTRLVLYFNDLSPISLHHPTDEESNIFLDDEKYYKVETVMKYGMEDKIREPAYKQLFSVGSHVIVFKKPFLGKSISYQPGVRITEIINGRVIFQTFILAVFSITVASIIGIILGVIAAIKQYSLWDNFAIVISVMGISVPSYVSATILAIVFAHYLNSDNQWDLLGPLFDTDDFGNPVTAWSHLILPVAALGIRPVAIITQLTRSSVLDVLGQDYVRTAKAKGLSRFTVLVKHTLRNALNPIVTSITGWFSGLLAGAFFVEIILDYKGLGYNTIKALQSFDYPVVMAAVLFIATVFILINIFVDILYSWLDPRVVFK